MKMRSWICTHAHRECRDTLRLWYIAFSQNAAQHVVTTCVCSCLYTERLDWISDWNCSGIGNSLCMCVLRHQKKIWGLPFYSMSTFRVLSCVWCRILASIWCDSTFSTKSFYVFDKVVQTKNVELSWLTRKAMPHVVSHAVSLSPSFHADFVKPQRGKENLSFDASQTLEKLQKTSTL